MAVSLSDDLALAEAAPLTGREVLYVGDAAAGFTDVYRRRNPKARTRAGGAPDPGSLDLVVLADGRADRIGEIARALRPGGALVVRQGPDIAVQIAALTAGGLSLAKVVNDPHGAVLVAVPAADAGRPRLHVEQWAFAPVLMDIRTRLPIAQLATDPWTVAHHRTPPFTLPTLPPSEPKIVIAQRPGRYREQDLLAWLAPTLAAGWLPVLESDDHPSLMAHVRGDSDDGGWLAARAMAAIQTSTPHLAEAFRAHNPEVKVFANAVFDLPPFPEGERPRRVFYGAVSRGPFAVEVARSLAPVVGRFADLEFVVVGDREVFEALPTARKAFEPYLPYEDYLARIRGCSVCLAPLAGRPFEETKSDAKFLDAAQSGALLIASPTVYGETVRHGVNGLIAHSLEDWSPRLAEALADGDRRQAMARCAWEDVREHRMFAEQIPQRRAWYEDLWSRRAALEAALCGRLPGLAEALQRLRA